MATYKADQLTNDAASPPVRGEFNRNGSAIRVKYATYTMGSTATEVATDVVQMVDVPKGSIIWPQLSYIWWTDCGGTITVDVGDDANDDKYCSALAMGTASTALTLLTEAATMDVTSLAHENTAIQTVDLTFDTVTTPNTTGVIYIAVFYSMNG